MLNTKSNSRLILTHQARFKIGVLKYKYQSRFKNFLKKYCHQSRFKIQDFPEQSLEFKQNPRMGVNFEFQQDSRLDLYLKEY